MLVHTSRESEIIQECFIAFYLNVYFIWYLPLPCVTYSIIQVLFDTR